jgi:hypothetical protein
MNRLVQPVFSHFDDSFSIHSSRDYCLSILVARHGFSFCISRYEDHVILGLEAYNFSISDTHLPASSDVKEWCHQLTMLLGNLESLKKSFRNINIGIEQPKSTLVPGALFAEEDKADWLLFNQPVADYEICREEELLPAMAKMLYTIPRNILSVLTTAFPEAEVFSASGQLINNLLSATHEAARDGVLYAHIQGAWVELVYLGEGSLKYNNTFSYQTQEDLAYYVIFVMEQLGLNPDTTVLVLLGEIERGSDHFELLYRYIRNIRFIDNSIMLEPKQMAADIPFHIYFNLINFARCGS